MIKEGYTPKGNFDPECMKKIQSSYKKGFDIGIRRGREISLYTVESLKNIITLIDSGSDLKSDVAKILIYQAKRELNRHENSYYEKPPKIDDE